MHSLAMTQALKRRKKDLERRTPDQTPPPDEPEDGSEEGGPDDYRGDADDDGGEAPYSIDDYSEKSVCVIDNGLFAEFAATLAPHFGRTTLYVPWESAYPKSNALLVGQGLEGVEKVDSLYDCLDADLFVFPDVYFGPLQEHLESLGKRVWGSRRGDELELDREKSKELLTGAGIDVGEYEVVVGLPALRKYLQGHKNRYVKVSRTRGDFETFKAENYDLVEPRLDELEHKLGAKKNIMRFIVEKAIPKAVEVGYDGYTIDGQFPRQAMTGIEIKDKAYVGVMQSIDQLPAQVREINDKCAHLLADYRYRNFWTAEARITPDGTPWVIDPCCRAGSPPSELLLLQYRNLADILWHGAAGDLVDPDPAGVWGAAVMLVSSWACNNWQAIQFPDAIRKHVKFHFPVRLDEKWYVVPQGFELPAIGAVVATGPTKKAAVDKVTKLAEQVKGYYIEADCAALESADEEFAELKAYGIDIEANTLSSEAV